MIPLSRELHPSVWPSRRAAKPMHKGYPSLAASTPPCFSIIGPLSLLTVLTLLYAIVSERAPYTLAAARMRISSMDAAGSAEKRAAGFASDNTPQEEKIEESTVPAPCMCSRLKIPPPWRAQLGTSE
ncbi:hypothetical protein SCP_1301350 [Sparassis crispa]|uniref:Uncharacterized protein n=1 Tax=Sparassis crispa TaxID=139825 RepID=A0A401H1T0_9APHY|nr:hypothetical protein SCP_1301350 [Sparassis crispa]GBE88320.1 hypothetical protein SCP_1301350 [Sparassis crispa]